MSGSIGKVIFCGRRLPDGRGALGPIVTAARNQAHTNRAQGGSVPILVGNPGQPESYSLLGGET